MNMYAKCNDIRFLFFSSNLCEMEMCIRVVVCKCQYQMNHLIQKLHRLANCVWHNNNNTKNVQTVQKKVHLSKQCAIFSLITDQMNSIHDKNVRTTAPIWARHNGHALTLGAHWTQVTMKQH